MDPSHHLKLRGMSKNAIRPRHELVDVHRAGSPVYVVRLARGRVRSFAVLFTILHRHLSDIIILTAEETFDANVSCDVPPFKLNNNIMVCLRVDESSGCYATAFVCAHHIRILYLLGKERD
jgi:hypothetical protein